MVQKERVEIGFFIDRSVIEAGVVSGVHRVRVSRAPSRGRGGDVAGPSVGEVVRVPEAAAALFERVEAAGERGLRVCLWRQPTEGVAGGEATGAGLMELHLGLEHASVCIHRGSSERLEALGLDGALCLCLLLSSSDLLEKELLLEKLDLLGAHLRQLETLRDSTC